MRVIGLDARSQQTKNLYQNPGSEKASFVATTERFRNLVSCPRPQGSMSGLWALGTGTGSLTTVASATEGGETFTRITRPAGDTVNTWRIFQGTLGANGLGTTGLSAVPIGGTVTILFRSRSSVAGTQVIASLLEGNGTNGAGGPTHVLSTDWKWYTAVITMTSKPTASTVFYFSVINPAMDNRTIDLSHAQVLIGDRTGVEFFAGDSTNNPLGLDFTYAWAGTVNASPSIATGPRQDTVITTNLMTNPCARGDLASWSSTAGTGGVNTFERITDGSGPFGTSYTRCTWTTAPTGGNPGTNFGADIPVAANEFVAVTMRVRCSAAVNIALAVDWYTSGNTYISSVAPSKVITANTWTEFTAVGQAPATTGKIVPHLRPGNTIIPTGMVLEATMVCITKTKSPVSYFDPLLVTGTWDDPDFLVAWTGTVNASTSAVRTALAVGVGTTGGAYPDAYQSVRNPTSGKKSLAFLTRDANTDAFLALNNASFPLGKKINISFDVFCAVGLPANSKIFRYNLTGVGDNTVNTLVAIPANTKTRISVDIDLTNATAYNFFRPMYGISVPWVKVYFDNIQVKEGFGSYGYIDGDSPYSLWLGSPHQSQSVGYPKSI